MTSATGRLYRVHFNSEDCDQWALGEPSDNDGNPLGGLFRAGTIAPLRPDILVPIAELGEPREFNFAGTGALVVTERVGKLIDHLAEGDVQRIPVRIDGAEEVYEILNILQVRDCIDANATRGDRWKEGETSDVAKVGTWFLIDQLRLNGENIPRYSIFRVAGYLSAVIVTEGLKSSLDQAGVEGLVYEDVSNDHALDASHGFDVPQSAPAVTKNLRERVDEHCERFLGCPISTITEIAESGNTVDVVIHPVRTGRAWHTVRTSGISERSMPVSRGEQARARTELMMYLPREWEFVAPSEEAWPVLLLRHLGGFLNDTSRRFSPGDTVRIAERSQTYVDGSLFSGVILFSPQIEPDGFRRFSADGEVIEFLWVCPLTDAELDFAIEQGLDALMAMTARSQLDHVVDWRRACLVTGRRPG